MRRAALAGLARLLVAGSLGLFGVAAAQDAAPTYAVLSLIGDELTLVTYQPSVGRSTDANLRQVVPLNDDTFDRRALAVCERSIRRAVPGARVSAFRSSDRALYAGQQDLVTDDARAGRFLQSIVKDLQGNTRFLVLVTKHRGDTRLRFADSSGGTGKLNGLGFYIDRVQGARSVETGESGAGYIAPYAYLSVSLVDVASGKVIRTVTATESQPIGSTRSKSSTDPWAALSAEEKVESVQQLIERGLDRIVPLAVAPG